MIGRRGFLGALAAAIVAPKSLAALAKEEAPLAPSLPRVTSGYAQTVMVEPMEWVNINARYSITTTSDAMGSVIYNNTFSGHNWIERR